MDDLNPIRSGLFQTVNDPGGGALKAPPPPPYDLENYCVTRHHIIHVNFTKFLGMIQSEFFKNSRFRPFYGDFKIKSSENSCKNNIFFILFEITFKYTKRRGIALRI